MSRASCFGMSTFLYMVDVDMYYALTTNQNKIPIHCPLSHTKRTQYYCSLCKICHFIISSGFIVFASRNIFGQRTNNDDGENHCSTIVEWNIKCWRNITDGKNWRWLDIYSNDENQEGFGQCLWWWEQSTQYGISFSTIAVPYRTMYSKLSPFRTKITPSTILCNRKLE